MEWLQFIQMILIPAFGWAVYRISSIEKDLNQFKIECAEKYATTEGMQRIENKLEDIRGLVISLLTKKGENNG